MNKKIIILASLGTAGYIVYKNLDKIKAMFSKFKGDVVEDINAEEATSSTTTSNSTAKGDYKTKVAKLQSLLKVGVDGIAGKQTNGALENLFSNPPFHKNSQASYDFGYPNLKKNGKGVVTPSNVDYYISVVSNKETPNDKFYKEQNRLALTPWVTK